MRRVLVSALVTAALTAVTIAGTAAAAPAAGAVPLSPTAAPSPAPSGSLGVRLLDVPTEARNDPRARQYLVDHLAPGAVIERRIEVSNTTAAPIRVALYPAAAAIQDGSFVGATGRTANELSTWTTLSQDVVELAPGAKAPVTLTLAVPADAAPGEQYAAVWAETGTPDTPGGVALVNRVGVRMYVSVGGDNPPPSRFTVDSLTAQRSADGRPVVTAQVHNTGGRALDMAGTLSLSEGPGSLSAGPFPAQLGSTLAPGQSAPVMIPLDQNLPDGPWRATLQLTSGLLEQTAEARIQFPSEPGAAAPVAAREVIENNPGIAIAALVLLAALVTATVVTARRRRTRRQTEPAAGLTFGDARDVPLPGVTESPGDQHLPGDAHRPAPEQEEA